MHLACSYLRDGSIIVNKFSVVIVHLTVVCCVVVVGIGIGIAIGARQQQNQFLLLVFNGHANTTDFFSGNALAVGSLEVDL